MISTNCGSNSVVECLVANENVEGSSPFSRSHKNGDLFGLFFCVKRKDLELADILVYENGEGQK
jgi:hypothetical protein